jgi:hypothetical protein
MKNVVGIEFRNFYKSWLNKIFKNDVALGGETVYCYVLKYDQLNWDFKIV